MTDPQLVQPSPGAIAEAAATAIAQGSATATATATAPGRATATATATATVSAIAGPAKPAGVEATPQPAVPAVAAAVPSVPWWRAVLRNPWVAAVVVFLVAGMLVWLGQQSSARLVPIVLVGVAASLAILKEICGAFARDRGISERTRQNLQDTAAIAAVYAAVFGFPGAIAAALPTVLGA